MGTEIPEDALSQNTETNDMCEKCHMKLRGWMGQARGRKERRRSKLRSPHMDSPGDSFYLGRLCDADFRICAVYLP
jgi:hypothetical protein